MNSSKLSSSPLSEELSRHLSEQLRVSLWAGGNLLVHGYQDVDHQAIFWLAINNWLKVHRCKDAENLLYCDINFKKGLGGNIWEPLVENVYVNPERITGAILSATSCVWARRKLACQTFLEKGINREFEPMLLAIKDIDSVFAGMSRLGTGHETSESELKQLVNEIVLFGANSNVWLIASAYSLDPEYIGLMTNALKNMSCIGVGKVAWEGTYLPYFLGNGSVISNQVLQVDQEKSTQESTVLVAPLRGESYATSVRLQASY